MENKVLKCIKVEPHKPPVVWELEDELSKLQEAVRGENQTESLIELVGIDKGVDLLLNEEGKLIGLEPNRRYRNDILVGTFYVVGADYETGELVSLKDDQLTHFMDVFAQPDEDISQDEVEDTMSMSMFFY